MDTFVNIIGIISLIGPAGVAIGQGAVIVGFPILLLVGMLDGQKGGRLGGGSDD